MRVQGRVAALLELGSGFNPEFTGRENIFFNAGVLGQAAPGIYELGGPDALSFADLMQVMLTAIRRRRLVLPLPRLAGRIMAFGCDAVQSCTLGLIEN